MRCVACNKHFCEIKVWTFWFEAKFFKEMKLLILGGNGFIGAEVCEQLLNQGHQLTLASRGSTSFDFKERILPRIERSVYVNR